MSIHSHDTVALYVDTAAVCADAVATYIDTIAAYVDTVAMYVDSGHRLRQKCRVMCMDPGLACMHLA